MSRAAILTGLAFALVGMVGCSSTPTAASAPASGQPAATVPASGSELGPAEFGAAITVPGTTVVDVRTADEFATGHLEGAVNIDVTSDGFAATVAELDPSGTYALYCRSGNRSGTAMAAMTGAGFDSVYHLGGGITAWQSWGGEILS